VDHNLEKRGLARIDPATNRVLQHMYRSMSPETAKAASGRGRVVSGSFSTSRDAQAAALPGWTRETMRVTRTVKVSDGAAGSSETHAVAFTGIADVL
jgi:hypothetical protein